MIQETVNGAAHDPPDSPLCMTPAFREDYRRPLVSLSNTGSILAS